MMYDIYIRYLIINAQSHAMMYHISQIYVLLLAIVGVNLCSLYIVRIIRYVSLRQPATE